jgi:hypothetical protein
VGASTNVTALTGIWSAVLVSGATVYQSGVGASLKTVSGPVALDDDAILYVTSGATASGVQDAGATGAAGYIYINSGGTLANSNITYDIVTVYAGGATSGNTFNNYLGSYVSYQAGTTSIAGGQSVNDTFNTVDGSTGTIYFYSGASVSGATVGDGTTLNAYDGATIKGATVNSGATFAAGADTSSISGVVVNSGGTASLVSGASTSAFTVSAGGLLSAGTTTVYGGVGASTNVTALTGIWSAVLVSGATVYQSGVGASLKTVSGPVALDDDAILYVTSGATASGVQDAGANGLLGTIYVNSGGTLANSNITYDNVIVYAGGSTSGNTFNGYGASYVSYQAGTTSAAGGKSVNDTFNTNDNSTSLAYFYSGASVSGATVSDGTTLYAYAGSTADAITVTSGGSVNTAVACFLPGTLIRTPSGEVLIEDVRIGDTVSVFNWRNGVETQREVTWVGSQKMVVRSGLPDDEAGYPVRVLKDAISDGVPYKDMLITPEHCLFFEDKFVPVRMLVNGRSIFYDRTITSYSFYHVETEEHSVIWADGMLTESYLDTGNRASFRQHGNLVILVGAQGKSWGEDGGAPLGVTCDFVEPLFRSIESRAEAGQIERKDAAPVLTDETDIHLVTETGTIIRKAREHDGSVMFMIPASVRNVRIVSNASRPSDVFGPFVDDRRRLGVAIGDITLFESRQTVPVTSHLTVSDLTGWHGLEGESCRWTTGDALLPLGERPPAGVAMLTLQLVAAGPYLVSDTDDQTLRQSV